MGANTSGGDVGEGKSHHPSPGPEGPQAPSLPPPHQTAVTPQQIQPAAEGAELLPDITLSVFRHSDSSPQQGALLLGAPSSGQARGERAQGARLAAGPAPPGRLVSGCQAHPHGGGHTEGHIGPIPGG